MKNSISSAWETHILKMAFGIAIVGFISLILFKNFGTTYNTCFIFGLLLSIIGFIKIQKKIKENPEFKKILKETTFFDFLESEEIN